MKKILKPVLRVLLAALIAGSCAAASLGDYKERMLPAASRPETGKNTLTVTFIGVATLLLDDGETAIMTDGFFSRFPQNQLRSIAPDRDAISRSLKRAGVTSLAAVIPVHSHYDHALDSPIVAMQTGALLVGSASTANIGKGYGMPEDRIRVVNTGDSMTFGKFKLTFVRSAHLPTGYATGPIGTPLSAPAAASDFKEGDCFSLFIEHGGRAILVQGSAGFVPDALKGRSADVVYLGIGGMGTTRDAYQQDYWQEMVRTVGAKRVIPIHWDNFFRSLDDGLVPQREFYGLMDSLLTRGKADGVDIRLSPQWVPVDPFAGL
jgi:L-ascorbate metabolism protein UlaG (beta-lactamase superfamily)